MVQRSHVRLSKKERKELIMALISCPECHREVSTMAKTCPHCGSGIVTGFLGPRAMKPQSSFDQFVGLFIGLPILLIVIVWILAKLSGY